MRWCHPCRRPAQSEARAPSKTAWDTGPNSSLDSVGGRLQSIVGRNTTHDFMGRALKSQFFRCVMQRTNMLRPIGYFCDEFQRYITTDPETGEHAFLDRCRAFRANSFLATQSMAALLAATNRGPNAGSALDSILVNTPTKICFRTTDPSAVSTMKSFIPGDPRSDNHVLSFRPPSSLQTGEYYFAFQHTWGRTRYKLPAHPH